MDWVAIRDTAKNTLLDVISILKTVVIVYIVMTFLNGYVIANAVVPTSSMSPAIEPGDRVVGLRFLRDYKRGDIIVFNDPDTPGRYLIKRIIGMPGDRVTFMPEENGACSVCINGKKLSEPYLPEAMLRDAAFTDLSLTVLEGSYFYLGDNRNNSLDARYWEHKFIAEDDVVAKAAFRYWPLSRSGLFKDPQYAVDTAIIPYQ